MIFEGATLVYRPDCNAEGGCHANSARAKRGRYWLWQPPEALQEGRYTSVAPEQNHAIIIITTWSHNVSSFYKLFACGSVPWGALVQSQILFVISLSHDRVDRSSLACARTWERTRTNNGHHVMRSSNQREAFLIAPATTATPISPKGRYWKCTFPGKYGFSTPSKVMAILQVMPRQVVIIGNSAGTHQLPKTVKPADPHGGKHYIRGDLVISS